MDQFNCKCCQKPLYTKDEISENLCSECARKIHPTFFCIYHPENKATGICNQCNKPLCDDCRIDQQDPNTNKIITLCQECAKFFLKEYYYCAWEDKSIFFYQRFWMTWKEIVFHPTEFYNRLPRVADKTSALTFAYLSSAHFFFLLALVVSSGKIPSLPYFMMGTLGLIWVTMMWLILVPMTLYFSAVIHHLGILLQFKRRDFNQTFRVIGYANAMQVLEGVPIINLIAGIWYVIIVVIGLKRVQKLSKWQAVLSIILIPTLMILLLLGFIFYASTVFF